MFKFNLDSYIAEYDYDLCGEDSGEEEEKEEEEKEVEF